MGNSAASTPKPAARLRAKLFRGVLGKRSTRTSEFEHTGPEEEIRWEPFTSPEEEIRSEPLTSPEEEIRSEPITSPAEEIRPLAATETSPTILTSRSRYIREANPVVENELAKILRARRERLERIEKENEKKESSVTQQGAESTTTESDPGEKCYDPNDHTLEFVDGDDDMDFECDEWKSLRAKMSCGHTVTPMSLTKWCGKLLDEGKTQFVCGAYDCGVKWPYDEIYKMALLTIEEIEYYERALFKIAAKDFLGIKSCPGCKSAVVRRDLDDLRVVCTECTVRKSRVYEFCWQCLKEWTSPSPHSDRCADPDCVNNQQELLRTCPDIVFEDVQGVTGCPSVRACPTCGVIIQHNREQCKNITCTRCNMGFCFVCLRLTSVCNSYWGKCSTGVAPRQTSIPLWSRR